MNRKFLLKIGNTVYDIESKYKVYVKELPVNIPLKPKNIYSYSWPDEDGNDNYIPDTIKYEAADIEVKLVCKNATIDGVAKDAAQICLDFYNALKSARTFSFYSQFFKSGRANVRVKELTDEATYSRVMVNSTEEQVLQFSMIWEVNSPATNITLTL